MLRRENREYQAFLECQDSQECQDHKDHRENQDHQEVKDHEETQVQLDLLDHLPTTQTRKDPTQKQPE